MLKYIQRTGRT